MRNLKIVVILFLLVILIACSEDNNNPNTNSYTSLESALSDYEGETRYDFYVEDTDVVEYFYNQITETVDLRPSANYEMIFVSDQILIIEESNGEYFLFDNPFGDYQELRSRIEIFNQNDNESITLEHDYSITISNPNNHDYSDLIPQDIKDNSLIIRIGVYSSNDTYNDEFVYIGLNDIGNKVIFMVNSSEFIMIELITSE